MKKILCIDDEKDYCDNIAQILETEGFIAMKAYSGKEGIETAILQKPDVIICDINMPLTNGFEVLDKLKKNIETTNIPVIFLTARDHKNDIIMSKNIGIEDYFIKPVDFDILLASINAAASKIVILRNKNTMDSGDLAKIDKCKQSVTHLSQVALENRDEQIISLCDKTNFLINASLKKGMIIKLNDYVKPELFSLSNFFENIKKNLPKEQLPMLNIILEQPDVQIEIDLEMYASSISLLYKYCLIKNSEIYVKTDTMVSRSKNYIVISSMFVTEPNQTIKSLINIIEFIVATTGAYISSSNTNHQHQLNIIFPVLSK